jgi:FkbM family methyltransferase
VRQRRQPCAETNVRLARGVLRMLAVVKKCVLKTSRSLGYDIVPLRDLKDRDFALHLRRLFEELKIDCVLDVGANLGQYRDFLRDHVFYDGLIVSFEPIAENVAALEKRSRTDRRWLIEGYALGSETRQMALNVMKSDQFSSFLQPDNSKVPAFGELNQPDHRELVEVRRLDDVFSALRERLGFRRPYLKLDTQGFDTEVVKGGEGTMPSICALQTEASVISIYEGMPSYIDTIRLLEKRGFDITGFYPVSRDAQLRLIEFDCVMRNRAAASRLK